MKKNKIFAIIGLSIVLCSIFATQCFAYGGYKTSGTPVTDNVFQSDAFETAIPFGITLSKDINNSKWVYNDCLKFAWSNGGILMGYPDGLNSYFTESGSCGISAPATTNFTAYGATLPVPYSTLFAHDFVVNAFDNYNYVYYAYCTIPYEMADTGCDFVLFYNYDYSYIDANGDIQTVTNNTHAILPSSPITGEGTNAFIISTSHLYALIDADVPVRANNYFIDNLYINIYARSSEDPVNYKVPIPVKHLAGNAILTTNDTLPYGYQTEKVREFYESTITPPSPVKASFTDWIKNSVNDIMSIKFFEVDVFDNTVPFTLGTLIGICITLAIVPIIIKLVAG